MTKSRLQIPSGPWCGPPDENDTGIRIAIWRCGQKTKHQVICLSEQILAANIHYAQGRSQPCGGHSCIHCDSAIPKRWQGYLITRTMDGSKIGILEITAGASPAAYEYAGLHGSLRGAIIRLWRTNGKKNGPVHLEVSKSDIDPNHLPQGPDLAKLLTRLWAWGTTSQPNATPEHGRHHQTNGANTRAKRPG